MSCVLKNVRFWQVISKAFSSIKDDRDPPGQSGWERGSQYPLRFLGAQAVAALQSIAWI